MTTRRLNLQNGTTSDVRSLNSNNYMSIQRSKVSIGILVEKSSKIVPGACGLSENISKLPVKGNFCSFHGKSENENEELEANSKRENILLKTRNKISDKWVHKERGGHSTPDAEVVPPLPTNGFTSLMTGDINKTSDCLTTECLVENLEHINVEDKSALASEHEMHTPLKDAVNAAKVGRPSHEGLRMKLLEILGSGPSQNKQIPSPQLPTSAENRQLDLLQDDQNSKQEKSIPSDPIETNSDSRYDTSGGPFSHSLAQKNVAKNQSVNCHAKSSFSVGKLSPMGSGHWKKLGETHVFSFDGVGGAEHSRGLNFTKVKQKNARNTSKLPPRKASSHKKPASFKSVQITEKRQVSSPPPESTSIASEAGTPAFGHPEKSFQRRYALRSGTLQCSASPNMEHQYPSQAVPETNSDIQSEDRISLKRSCLNKDVGGNMSCVEPCLQDDPKNPNRNQGPKASRNFNDREKFSNCSHSSGQRHSFHELPSPTLAGSGQRHPSDELPSPTLAGYTSHTTSTEKSSEQLGSPAMDQKISFPGASDQKINSLNSRLQSSESATQSKDTEGSIDSLTETKSFAVHCKSLPPKTVPETEKLGVNDDSSKDCTRREKWFSDVDSIEKSPFALRKTKRIRFLEERNPNKPDVEEGGSCHEASEQFQEDCLPKAVSQLLRIVEKLQTKLKSQENKKGSEILSSVAGRLHMQMLTIETQIQADIKRFTGLARSKRKHFEATFEAQQEKLKSMHQKFKAELNRHLNDCTGTFEELEAFGTDLKGQIDTQKASHKKLLVQVEEDMKVQLSEAESSITAIQQAARKKIKSLKYVMTEWLNEVALS